MRQNIGPRRKFHSLIFPLTSIIIAANIAGVYAQSDPRDALCVVKGKPKESANHCADADANCVAVLGIQGPTPAGGTAPARVPRKPDDAPDAACYLPANALKANHCKFTCAKCCELPEYECDDEASPILGKCDKKDCTNPAKKKYMEISCRSTCGWCNQPLPPDPSRPGCMDKVNCAPWKKYCNDPKYEKDLKENCARTCDFCPKGMNVTTTTASPFMAPVPGTGAAVDLGQNCLANIDMCNNPLFRQIMQENCAATCRNAPPAPAGTITTVAPVIGRDISELLDGLDCVDANPNCATWERRRNFCTNTFYTSQSKEDTCAKTCGYC